MANSSEFSNRLDRSWDDNAPAWITTVREGGIESRRVTTDQAIINAVRQYSPKRILDVGCGEGWLCRALSTDGIQCIGIDGSSDLIAAAQAADPSGQYHLLPYAQFERLPEKVGAASFDLAIFNFSLLHQDIRPILEALPPALSSNGVLLIQTVHPWIASKTEGYVDGWRTEDFTWSEHCFPQAMPWFFRTLESWVSTLRESGFELRNLTEPLHPESKKPLSLILEASPVLMNRPSPAAGR
jgi:2-polyprenyl-3-methyl-5-hydroxy-6-metoxy-1,4-benzoquinol methylase